MKVILKAILRPFRDLINSLYRGIKNYKSRHLIGEISKNIDDELLKKGIVIFSGDSDFAGWLRQRIPDQLLATEKQRMLQSVDPLDFVIDIAPKLSDECKLGLIKWATDSERVKKAANYLGFVPRVATIYVLYNISKVGRPVGSMKWHRDTMVHKGLNIFMAISDIDDQSGVYSAIPLDVIPESKVIELKVNDIDTTLPVWDRYRVSDEVMSRFVSDNQIIELKGPPGTTAIVASGDVYHKGGHCISKDRIMLEVSYQSDCFQGGHTNLLGHWGLLNHTLVNRLLDDPVKNYLLEPIEKKGLVASMRKAIWWISRVPRSPLGCIEY